MTGRTIIIGDIHGCVDELTALLSPDAGVGLTKEDKLVLVGDLIDKGPVEGSAGVVRLLRTMKDDGFNITLVKGNHEEKHERFRVAFAKAGDKVQSKGAEEMKAITALLSPEDIAFLESAVLFHQIPEHNALVVHAGILPSLEALPTAEELAAMSKGEVSKFARILRTRYVRGKAKTKLTLEFEVEGEDTYPEVGSSVILGPTMAQGVLVKKKVYPEGEFLSLGTNGPDDPYWADVYDGRFGHVFFGHEPFHDEEFPKLFPHARGLDLGCVFGNKLAAVILEGDKTTCVTVDALRQYADKREANEE